MLCTADSVKRIPRWPCVAAAALLCACPGPGAGDSGGGPKPPPFLAGAGAGGALEDPPPPPADKPGLPYLQVIYPKLRDRWRSFVSDCRLRLPPSDALNDASLAATVAFRVAADGRLLAISVADSSGDARFDAAAQEVVRDAAPFPPPPAGLVSDDETVHLTWLFARDARLAGMATAEVEIERWPVGRAVPKLLERGNVADAAARLVEAAGKAPAGAAVSDDEMKTLVALGRRVAAATLVEALKGKDKGVKRLALEAVASSHVDAAAPLVLELAGKAMDKGLRIDAIAALGAVGGKKAIPLLVSVLDDKPKRESTEAEIAASRSLAALGQGKLARARLEARLGSAADGDRLSALAVLARFPVPEAADALAEILGSDRGSRVGKQTACAALGAAATESNQADVNKALRKGLDSRDAAVRAACAHAVAAVAEAGLEPGRATYWKLIALLKDRDERVRAGALLAAAQTDPKRFARELYVVLRDKSPLVRVALAEALGRVPGAVAYKRLAHLATSKDVAVRRKAAAALLHRPEQQARELLAGMIGDSDAAVRLVALEAVDGADALAALLDGQDKELGAAALARLVAVRGHAGALVEVFQRLAKAPAGSADRVRIVAAWLRP